MGSQKNIFETNLKAELNQVNLQKSNISCAECNDVQNVRNMFGMETINNTP